MYSILQHVVITILCYTMPVVVVAVVVAVVAAAAADAAAALSDKHPSQQEHPPPHECAPVTNITPPPSVPTVVPTSLSISHVPDVLETYYTLATLKIYYGIIHPVIFYYQLDH